MRKKDENKKKALFRATIKMVNETGFAASSVSKIAKEASVSPSTLYVFFENKDDLLVSTYLEIKYRLSEALLSDFDEEKPIRDIVKIIWMNLFNFVSNNLEEYDYAEQFANSPYSSLVDKEILEKEYAPLINVFIKGIEQKIIKDVDLEMLAAFFFSPASRLANPRLTYDLKIDSKILEKAFDMAWDAIKL